MRELESDGLVRRRTDASDRRHAIVALTARGSAALAADRRHREGWLATAIARDLSPEEQGVLARAVEILARLSDS